MSAIDNNLSLKFYISIILVFMNCGFIPLNNKKDGEYPFLLLLGLGGVNAPAISPQPEFRLNGFLRDSSNQALKDHGINNGEIVNLTNNSGLFTLYLTKGKHRLNVQNSENEYLGSFAFSLESQESFPEIEYDEGVPFQVIWEDVITLPQNTIDPTVGQAELIINEVVPRASSGPKIELFVISGGNLQSTQLCARNSCSDLPEIRVRSGEYILLYEGDGINDAIIGDGNISNAWEFYGIPSLVSTDSVVYIRSSGVAYESVVIYADNGGSWNGCNGTSGISTCIPPILSAGKWTQSGENWEETDAIIRQAPSGTYFNNDDTIRRCPNGTKESGKTSLIYSYNLSDRNLGSANLTCPGFNLISARPINPTTLEVSFSANPTSGGNNLSNYKIFQGSSCSGSELSISNVTLSGSIATITTDTQVQGGNYIVCVENMVGGVENFPIGGKSVVFSGYAPTAELSINELAPGLGTSDDFVEFFVRTSGTLNNLEFCYRSFSNCNAFPDRIVQAGEYIVWYSGSGVNDQSKSDGNQNFWEFFNAPSQAGTDAILLVKNSNTIQSVLAYADGGGTWTGCGSTGDTGCIDPVVTANAWHQAGGTWAESDAVRKNPVGSFSSSDTIAKIPNGTGSDSLSTWRVYSNTALRTIGSANIEPVSVGRGQIVINEVRRESSGSSHWVEFFNRTSQAINMAEAGLYFKRISTCDSSWSTNTTNTVPLTGTIPANGYYILTITTGIPGNEDQTGNFSSFTDNNCIFLTKTSSNPISVSDSSIVDFVGWGTAQAIQGTAATNLSNSGILQRVPNGAYTDGESHSSAFGFVGSCAGTPKLANPGSNICNDVTPPTVSSVNPSNGTTDVALVSTIVLTFSEAMNPSTIATHTSTTCSGSIQVSTDSGFGAGTCIPMSSASPTASGGDSVFTLTPSSSLPASTTVYIRITNTVADTSGNNLASTFSSNFTTGSPFRTLPYSTSFEIGNPEFVDNSNLYDVSQGDSLTDNLTARTGSRFLFGTGITTTTYTSRQIDSNDFIQLSGSSDLTISAYIARRTDYSLNTIDSRISILWFNDYNGTPNTVPSSEGGEVTNIGSTYTLMSFTATPPAGAGYFKIRMQVRKSSGSSTAVANTRLAIDDVNASQ